MQAVETLAGTGNPVHVAVNTAEDLSAVLDEDSPLPTGVNVHITIQNHLDLTSLDEALRPIGSVLSSTEDRSLVTINV